MLALTAGCSSTLSGTDRISDSRRDAPNNAQRNETRYPAGAAANERDRTVTTAEPSAPMRADSSMTISDNRSVPTPVATADNDNSTAAEQRDRVTVVTSTPPPLSRVETPSHEPRDGEFWIAGMWRGESGEYVWQAGRIDHDRSGQLYVPANWAASPRGWEYTPEFWR
jgi:hypothetical protein